MFHGRDGDLHQPAASPLSGGGPEARYLPSKCCKTHHPGNFLDEGHQKSEAGLPQAEHHFRDAFIDRPSNISYLSFKNKERKRFLCGHSVYGEMSNGPLIARSRERRGLGSFIIREFYHELAGITYYSLPKRFDCFLHIFWLDCPPVSCAHQEFFTLYLWGVTRSTLRNQPSHPFVPAPGAPCKWIIIDMEGQTDGDESSKILTQESGELLLLGEDFLGDLYLFPV